MMTIWKPTPCQIESRMMDPRAVADEPSQSCAGTRPPVMNWTEELSRPSGLRSRTSRQMTATSAIGKTTGMKKNVRKKRMPLSLRLSRIARTSASPV